MDTITGRAAAFARAGLYQPEATPVPLLVIDSALLSTVRWLARVGRCCDRIGASGLDDLDYTTKGDDKAERVLADWEKKLSAKYASHLVFWGGFLAPPPPSPSPPTVNVYSVPRRRHLG